MQWKEDLVHIPSARPMSDSWGPSSEELNATSVNRYKSNWILGLDESEVARTLDVIAASAAEGDADGTRQDVGEEQEDDEEFSSDDDDDDDGDLEAALIDGMEEVWMVDSVETTVNAVEELEDVFGSLALSAKGDAMGAAMDWDADTIPQDAPVQPLTSSPRKRGRRSSTEGAAEGSQRVLGSPSKRSRGLAQRNVESVSPTRRGGVQIPWMTERAGDAQEDEGEVAQLLLYDDS